MTAAGSITAPAALTVAAGGPGTGIPGIGRRAAQRLARTELSKRIYHQQPSLLNRILHAVSRWLHHLFQAANAAPGGWWGMVALIALAVILVAVVLTWVGPVARARRGTQPLTPGLRARTAREYREISQRLANAGDYAGAIRERVRAIATELDERGILLPRAGRTADEFGAEAGRALPGLAGALRDAVREFDDVCYGGRPGTQAGYERVCDLDAQVKVASPRPGPAAAPPPASLVGGRVP